MVDATAKTKAAASGIKGSMGTILSTASNLAMMVGGFMLLGGSFDIAAAAGTIFGGVVAALTSPITLTIAAVAALAFGAYELWTHWNTVWSAIKSATAAVVGFLSHGIGELILVLMGPVGAVIYLAIHWKAAWATVQQVVSTAVKWVQGALASFMSWYHSYSGEIDTVGHAIADVFKVVWANIGNIVKDAWVIIKAVVSVGWSVIKGIFSIMAAFLQGSWKNLWAILGATLKAAWSIIVAVITAVWDTIKGIFETAFAIIKGVVEVGLDVLTGHWSRAWNDMLSTIKSVWHDIQNTISGVYGQIMKIFSSAGTWLYDVGKNIIMGLVHGIESALGAVGSAVKHVASSAVNAVKSFLGIASPSRVMMVIGTQVVQGLAQGITGSSGLATGAMTGVGSSLFGSAQNMSRGMSMGGSGAFGGGINIQATFEINAPGGNATAIKDVISTDAAQAFAQQTLAALRAGAGTIY
jgi:phage-related protein